MTSSSLTSAAKQTHLFDKIHDYAQRGNLEGVIDILTKNPDLISSYDIDGQIPLHFAAKFGHFEMVQYLIEQGKFSYRLEC